MYTADGQFPQYDESEPFRLQVLQTIGGNLEDISENEKNHAINYDWATLGQVYYAEWQTEQNLIQNSSANLIAKRNEHYFKPIDTNNGLCVTNAVMCYLTQGNTEIGNIHIPVHFYINRFGNAAMNGWDGNSISIDENNGLILSPQVGAGSKNEDNSFTGVFMGSIQEAGSEIPEHGLFGYNAGQRTISLNAEDGSAKFGTEGGGQIVIDPNDGETGHAYLRSGDYKLVYARVSAGQRYTNSNLYFKKEGDSYIELKKGIDYKVDQVITESNIYKATDQGSGMEIDLTDPHIRFGSGRFRVDSDGSVFAEEYALAVDFEEVKTVVSDLEESVSYFEVAADAASVNIACNSLQIPLAKNINIPVTFTGTFKGKKVALIEGLELEECIITIEGNHSGLTLTKNFTSSKQEIIISTNNTQIISDLINDYTISFEYHKSDTEIYIVTKQLSVVLAVQGADGEPGPAGKDGTSITVKGSYSTLRDLLYDVESGIITPTSGDSYIIQNDLYVYTNGGSGSGTLIADWENVGRFSGADAKNCFITASTEIFRSDDGGDTYSPDYCTLIPYFQAIDYQGWDFSIDGGNTYIDISTPVDGLSFNIETKQLTIQNNCELFNLNSTLTFRCRTNDSNVYDTISISRIKDGVNGERGPQGESGETSYLHIAYANSADGTEDFSIVNAENKKYIGQYADFKSDASTNPQDYKWTLIKGTDGKGISSTSITYQANISGTDTPTGVWQENIPDVAAGSYLWTRTIVTYTDNSISTSYSVGKMGNTGSTGKDGASITIKSTSITYQAGTSGTIAPTGIWSSSIPEIESGQYLWTKTEVVYSDNTSTTAYSVSYKGANGIDGTSITITDKSITYQISNSGTIIPIGDWSLEIPAAAEGQYLWTRTIITYNTGDSVTSYSVAYQGINGTDGADGASVTVSSTSTTYQISNSSITVPTGSWSDSIIKTTATEKYLWTRVIVTFSDGSQAISYSVSSTMDSIKVGGRNLIWGSQRLDHERSIDSLYVSGYGADAVPMERSDSFYEIQVALDGGSWDGLGYYVNSLDLKDGDYLTAQVMVRSVKMAGRISLYLMLYDKDNNRLQGEYLKDIYNAQSDSITPAGSAVRLYSFVKNETKKIIVSFAWTQAAADVLAQGGNAQITFQFSDTSGDEDAYGAMWAPKLEYGNTATDWSPAPEDVDNAIQSTATDASEAKGNAQEALNQAQQAQNKAEEVSNKINNIQDKTSQLEQAVEQSQVQSTYFQYCTVEYEYDEIPIGTPFDYTAVYYNKTKDNYTKVRPDVDFEDKITSTCYIKKEIGLPDSTVQIYTNKPAWQDGFRIYQRTVIVYNDGTTKIGAWDLLDDYQTVDDRRYLDAQEVISIMRGDSNIFYNKTGLYCYNNATEATSTNKIILNNGGIIFGKRQSVNDPWKETTVWKIDGTFDAQSINVINLRADTIKNGILTLGSAAQDGGIVINDDNDTTKFELNSQRFCCMLNNGGYVLVGKDIGFQVLSAKDEIQYGSDLTWTPITGDGTKVYENNINYYRIKGNFSTDSLIIPETPGEIIPNNKTVYTVSCGNIFTIKQVQIDESLYFGEYIQTININTVDNNGRVHRGVAFIARQ